MVIPWADLYKMTSVTTHFLKQEVQDFPENKGKTRFAESPCFQTAIRNLKPKK